MNNFLRRFALPSAVALTVAGGCWVAPEPLPDDGGSCGCSPDDDDCNGWGGYGGSSSQGSGGVGGSGGKAGGGSGGKAGGGSGGKAGSGSGGQGGGGNGPLTCQQKYEACSANEACAKLVSCGRECSDLGLPLSEFLPLCLDFAGIVSGGPELGMALAVNSCIGPTGPCADQCSFGGGNPDASCPPSEFEPPGACGEPGLSECVECQCAN